MDFNPLTPTKIRRNTIIKEIPETSQRPEREE